MLQAVPDALGNAHGAAELLLLGRGRGQGCGRAWGFLCAEFLKLSGSICAPGIPPPLLLGSGLCQWQSLNTVPI